MVKVFNVSLHRSATQSFVAHGRRLGLRTAHWPGLCFDADCEPALEKLDTGLIFERYASCVSAADAFADLPVPIISDRLMAAYPQASFVLALRSPQGWIASVREHLRDRELDVLERLLYWRLCDRRQPRLADYSDAELDLAYRRHVASVSRGAVEYGSDLHVVNVEDLGSSGLIDRLFGSRGDAAFPHVDVNARRKAQPHPSAREPLTCAPADTTPADATTSLDTALLRAWRATSLSDRLDDARRAGHSGNEEDFVEPQFVRAASSVVGTDQHVLALDSLVHSRANHIVLAPPNSGKTTLLRHLASRLARTEEGRASVPVMVDFTSIAHYPAVIIKIVREQLAGHPATLSADVLLKTGICAVLVDDVDLTDTERLQILMRFVETFHACRYILVSKAPVEIASNLSQRVFFECVDMRDQRDGAHVVPPVQAI